MKMAMIVLLSLSLMGCYGASDVDAIRVLEMQGYTEIQITGWKPFACSRDDGFPYGFTAKSPSGKNITGAVCFGVLFKNATVRFG